MAFRHQASIAALVAAGFVAGILVAGAAFAGGGTVPVASALNSSYADEIAEEEEKKEQNEKERKELEAALKHTNAKIVEANKKLQDLNKRLPEAQQELEFAEQQLQVALQKLREAEEKLAAAQAEDERISALIAADQQRMDKLRGVLSELARAAYRGDGSNATLRLVLGSASTEDFVNEYMAGYTVARTQATALEAMEQIAAQNRNRGDRQGAVREHIEKLKVVAEQHAAEAEKARAEAERRKAEIEDLLEQQREIKAFLERERKEYLKQQEELEKEGLAIRRELQRLISLENDELYGDGTWGWPLSNVRITSNYGYRIHPIYGDRRLHAGTDFGASCGTPVKAAADGKVQWRYYRGGYGNQVMLTHPKKGGKSYNSSYSHLSKFNVSVGDLVVRGDVIGYVGTTGSSTGCHLHLEVYVNGSTVNPLSIVPS